MMIGDDGFFGSLSGRLFTFLFTLVKSSAPRKKPTHMSRDGA